METFGIEESIVRGPYCGDCICMCFSCACPTGTNSSDQKDDMGRDNNSDRTNTPYW